MKREALAAAVAEGIGQALRDDIALAVGVGLITQLAQRTEVVTNGSTGARLTMALSISAE